MSSERIPKRKGRSDVESIQGGAGRTQQTRGQATSAPKDTTNERKIPTCPPDEWFALLDAACTTAALVAFRLALTTRYLDAHDHLIADGCGLGAYVAFLARMTTKAAEAASLLHGVAADYAEWMVTP